MQMVVEEGMMKTLGIWWAERKSPLSGKLRGISNRWFVPWPISFFLSEPCICLGHIGTEGSVLQSRVTEV